MGFVLAVLLIYVVIVCGLSYWIMRKETDSDYIIASRSTKIWQTSISQFVSGTDGTGLIILLTWGVLFSYGLLWYCIGGTIGTLLFAWVAPRLHDQAHRHEYVTISDVFTKKVGVYSTLLVTLIILFTQWFATAGQLHVAGNLFSSVSSFDPIICIFGVTAVLLTYMVMGGYAAVVKTDVLQGAVFFGVLFLAFVFGKYTSIPEIIKQVREFGTVQIAGFVIWGIIYGFGNLFLWQRTFSADKPQTARISALINIPLNWVSMVGVIIFSQMLVALYPEMGTDNLVLNAIARQDAVPVLGPLVALGFVVLFMSSVDSYMALFSSTLLSNLAKIDPVKQHKKYVRLSRIVVTISFILLASLATFIGDFVQYMVNTVSLLFVLMGAMFVPIFVNAKLSMSRDYLFVAVLVISLALWFYMFFTGMFTSLLMATMPSLVSFGLSSVVLARERLRPKLLSIG